MKKIIVLAAVLIASASAMADFKAGMSAAKVADRWPKKSWRWPRQRPMQKLQPLPTKPAYQQIPCWQHLLQQASQQRPLSPQWPLVAFQQQRLPPLLPMPVFLRA